MGVVSCKSMLAQKCIPQRSNLLTHHKYEDGVIKYALPSFSFSPVLKELVTKQLHYHSWYFLLCTTYFTTLPVTIMTSQNCDKFLSAWSWATVIMEPIQLWVTGILATELELSPTEIMKFVVNEQSTNILSCFL